MIGNCLSAVRNAATTTASTVYGFGKDLFGKGSAACSFLAEKVSQVAGRLIPNAVSNTVKAYPKTFSVGAGLACGVGAACIYIKNMISGDNQKQIDFLNTLTENLSNRDNANNDTVLTMIQERISTLNGTQKQTPYSNI